jgi:hypothetical protein
MPRPRFTTGKETHGTHWTRGWWASEPVWTQRLEEKSSLSLPGIEPRSPGRPVRSQDTIPTELPQFHSRLPQSFAGQLSYIMNIQK